MSILIGAVEERKHGDLQKSDSYHDIKVCFGLNESLNDSQVPIGSSTVERSPAILVLKRQGGAIINEELYDVDMTFKGSNVKWSLPKLVKIVDDRGTSIDEPLHIGERAAFSGIVYAGRLPNRNPVDFALRAV